MQKILRVLFIRYPAANELAQPGMGLVPESVKGIRGKFHIEKDALFLEYPVLYYEPHPQLEAWLQPPAACWLPQLLSPTAGSPDGFWAEAITL